MSVLSSTCLLCFKGSIATSVEHKEGPYNTDLGPIEQVQNLIGKIS